MRIGFDTSDPGTTHLVGYDVAGGYLGGDTPHAWSREQWDAQDARWRCPFWVPWPSVDPRQQAADIVTALRNLQAPVGTIYFLDVEALNDTAIINAIANDVHASGYLTGVYGSESTVFANPPRSGYLVALWDGLNTLYEHPHAVGKQYRGNVIDKSGVKVDLDVFTDDCPLWDTRPGSPPQLPSWAAQCVADLNQIEHGAAQIRADLLANVK
jgi:Domain of unknown function (DUF1906)